MSQHFTLQEFTSSSIAQRLGIDNSLPDDRSIEATITLAGAERIRAFLGGHPIRILSGYRCPELNAAVQGADHSQHMHAEALDLVCPGFGSILEVFVWLSNAMETLGIDQLILEPGWLHVSFTLNPRYEVLHASASGYVHGLP